MTFKRVVQPGYRPEAGVAALLLLAMLIVSTLSISYTGLSRAFADDYCRAAFSAAKGAWLEEVVSTYMLWSGRWLATALYAFSYPKLHIETVSYNIGLFLFQILWAGMIYVSAAIFCPAISVVRRALFSWLILVVYLVGGPKPGETWYWLTGAVEYELPMAMAVGALAIISRPRMLQAGLASLGGIALAAVLGFLLTGLNELVGILLAGATFVIVVALALQRRFAAAAKVGAVMIAVIVGIAVNGLAPGSAVRATEGFPGGGDLATGVRVGLLNIEGSPLRWLVDPRLILLGLALAASRVLGDGPKWFATKIFGAPWGLVLPAVMFAAVMSGHMLVSYIQGAQPPDRVESLLYAIFVFAVVALGMFASQHVFSSGYLAGRDARILKLAAASLLAAAIVLSLPVTRGAWELWRLAPDWSVAVDARVADVRRQAAAGRGVVDVGPVEHIPYMFAWSDLQADPAYWTNDCFARAMHVQAVRVRASPKP